MKEDYYNTKESAKEYIKLAEGYSGIELIEKLEQVLPADSLMLEIGSGPGTDWKILNRSYSVIGSDYSTVFLEYLIADNPQGEFIKLDAVTLETNKKFDAIYSNKVLHHLQDSELTNSIKRQYEILNNNGIICHSFWKGAGSEIFKGLFVNYHKENNLKEFYSEYFEIISIESYKEFDEGDSLLLIAKKK